MNTISLGRRTIIALLVLLSVTSLGIGISIILGYSGNATSSQVAHNQDRQDCKSVVAAQRGAVLDARDNLQFDGLIGLAIHDDAGVAKAKADAPAMKAALKVLPRADEIVANGWVVPQVVRDVVPNLPAYIAPCPA